MYGQQIKTTQDWQLQAYEMQSKHNRYIRHQRNVNEMEYNNCITWGKNMSRSIKNET